MGHLQGDEILKNMAGAALKSLRFSDVLFRWGGDEFIILAYGDINSAVSVADRVRKNFNESYRDFSGNENNEIEVTISCGVAEFGQTDTLDSVLARADAALYRAKSGGRNRVES